jgi:hypothetical protein
MQEAAGAEGLDISEDAVYDALLGELPSVKVSPLRLVACTWFLSGGDRECVCLTHLLFPAAASLSNDAVAQSAHLALRQLGRSGNRTLFQRAVDMLMQHSKALADEHVACKVARVR